MTSKLIDDCFHPGQPRLRHAEALSLLKAAAATLTEPETVALANAAGRTLAEPVAAPHPVPAHTNAAVDGYAFAVSGYDRSAGSALALTGRAAAGHPLTDRPGPGVAVRIFTGAVMPAGCDTVVMQEDVTLSPNGETVTVPPGLKPGANVREAGEDVAEGEVLFAAGDVLRPQDLAALAAIGRGDVAVYQRLSVAVISTGDEVVRAGSGPLAPGQVYDANAPMLKALAELAGADVTDLGIWPDDPAVIRTRLAQAAQHYDVLLTSGGASMGEEDHMARAVAALGRRHVWQLAIKPGRPMMFGQISQAGRDTIIVGLPGNPVAVFVCFLMYVYPLLRRTGGGRWLEPRREWLPAAFSFTGRKAGRREFWRGVLREEAGEAGNMSTTVDKYPRDGSGLISGLRAADGLIDIPEDAGDITPGDRVAFIPFSQFCISSR